MKTKIHPLLRCAVAAAVATVLSSAALAGGPEANAAQLRALQQDVTRVIVKFQAGTDAMAAAQAVAARQGVKLSKVRDMALDAQVMAIGRKLTLAQAERLTRALSGVAGVEFAVPDRLMQVDMVPNDPLYSELPQWHYNEAAGGIALERAWDKSIGTGVVVGVIDTGARPHRDLRDNLITGYDFISNASSARDGNGRDASAIDEGDWCTVRGIKITNSSWHGTHVAGTVAAATNNGIGVAGVAFGAKVMPLRALGRCGGQTADILDAITWASGGTVPGLSNTTTPARVINMSLGGTGACDAAYQSVINAATARGTVIVVSAGNDNGDSAVKTPASCNNVITVAATGRTGGRATYSNTGATVEVAAPGGSGDEYVWSTLNSGKTTAVADAYAGYQGTSMAAPHVAGLAALIIAKNPALTAAQVGEIITTSARAFPEACVACGTGIINANRALNGTP